MSDYRRRRSALLKVIQGLENEDVVSDDVVEFDEIDQSIPENTEDIESDELTDDVEVSDEETVSELPEDQDDETIISDEQIEEVLNALDDGDEQACDEQVCDEFADADDEGCDEFEDADDEFENDDEGCEGCDEFDDDNDVTASEIEPGIEDEIEDTEGGGDPTVSQVAPGGDEAKDSVQTDAEVYPTESAYVASLVRKFDRIANELEKKGMKKLAYRLDRISDYMERHTK